MSPRSWIIAETNWKHVKATRYEVAMLPWGATEAHNWHLPYATDSLQNDAIAAEAGRIAWEAGAIVLADLSSRNGTFVRIVGEHVLDHGDYVFMGQELLRVEIV